MRLLKKGAGGNADVSGYIGYQPERFVNRQESIRQSDLVVGDAPFYASA